MIKAIIALTVMLVSCQLYAHDLELMLNNTISFDDSGAFDFPKSKKFRDQDCKRRANKRAVYSINYTKNESGVYEITIRDRNGRDQGEDHLACIYSQHQSIKFKAGKNVRTFKLEFFTDKEKLNRGCPVDNQRKCVSLRREFKPIRIFQGKKLIGRDVAEYYYNIVINPDNGRKCVTSEINEKNQREDSCVLDPKIKIVR